MDEQGNRKDKIRAIERRLSELEDERKRLLADLAALQSPVFSEEELPPLRGIPAAANPPQLPEDKVRLFLTLFRGRESVFPKLWENKAKGTKGYSPACRNEWQSGICNKPQTKCTDCTNQAFLPLDEQAVRDHLQGRYTVGTYAIREDESCVFLAADFDGEGWKQDVLAYRAAARELGIKVELERSRSGDGGHAWIFFLEPVSARLARQLGTVIVARAQASRHTMGLSTYDRFFPNQDTLPKGGFGNLIALPLQKQPREGGNSVFLGDDLEPSQNQWQLLASALRLSSADVCAILERELSSRPLQFVPYEDEAIANAEHALDSGSHKIVPGCFTGQIEIEIGARLSVRVTDLPSSVLSALKRTATFANPVFFERERLRFSTWNTPRFIFCGELYLDRLILPRGVLESCLEIARKAGASVVLRDGRPNRPKLKASFTGELSSEQKRAVAALAEHEFGVLVAPPGAGKTVMGCSLIAKRKTPTLVLVHRAQLLDQWKLQLSEFLGVDPKEIGTFGGSRKKPTAEIDIGMLPTLAKMKQEDSAGILSAYGQVIIDECHHLPAVSFDKVLQRIPAKYVVGLTATPYRKDGHQAIIHMQCGPTRYEVKHVDGPALRKRVIVRETKFKLPEELGPQPAIHLVWERLVADPARLDLVAGDLRDALTKGRFPLIISERKEHLALLAQVFDERLRDLDAKSFTLVGGMGKKARAGVLEEIRTALAAKGRPYLLATGSFIGEGFDFPALDTLIIAMPVSFKGKLIQYAGRLHRSHPGKDEVIIYDYLDTSSALTVSMFRKRLAAYRKMEYQVEAETGTRADRMASRQEALFFPRRASE